MPQLGVREAEASSWRGVCSRAPFVTRILAGTSVFSGNTAFRSNEPPAFDRASAARAFVAHSHGAIREVPTPFPGSTLFEPTGPRKSGAIELLHGSEGGSQPYSMAQAADLAAHGYPALAFSYFDVPGSALPKKLLDVPLERTQQAADWLKARYGKVGLLGVSRGGEQALELASLDKDGKRFAAVAGVVPSSQVWGAFDPKTQEGITDQRGNIRSAWTLGGKPIPEGQKIPLEKYPGPVFLQGSGRDQTWPSAQYVRQLEHRLEVNGKHAEVHIFPNEDHILSPRAWPIANKMLLDFFDRTLR
jgi:dienelactone hydrolase